MDEDNGQDPAHEKGMARVTLGIAFGLFSIVADSVNLACQALDTNSPYKCKRCSATLPRFRVPKGIKEALIGGGTCPKCGCRSDHHGNSID